MEEGVRHKFVRDPVHGFIGFPEDLYETLIDTELFQRLREVRQLALSHLVYPGANHTRFEHSLGVAHVVRNMLESVRRNTIEYVLPYADKMGLDKDHVNSVLNELEEMSKEAIVAALLHDIGHVALSHVFDKSAEDLVYLSFPKVAVVTVKDHEHRTVKAVAEVLRDEVRYGGKSVNMKLVALILSKAYGKDNVDLKERLKELGFEDPLDAKVNAIEIIAQMISSDIDADRGDYILRDSYFSGSLSQIYDIGRLYNVIALMPESQGSKELRLGIIDKGTSVIENMLLSRIYMYKDVYLHTVSMIYSAMAARFLSLTLAAREKLLDLIPEMKYARKIFGGDSPELKEALLSFTDSTFYEILRKVSRLEMTSVTEGLEGEEKQQTLTVVKAMKSLARGILERRHWSAFILYDNAAAKLASRIERDKKYFIKIIKKYLDPFVIFYWNSYTAYKGNVPLFDRSRPRVHLTLHESQTSTIADKIKDVRYAKVIIVVPKIYGDMNNLMNWKVKNGRYEPEPSEAEEVEEAFHRAKELASMLTDWTT